MVCVVKRSEKEEEEGEEKKDFEQERAWKNLSEVEKFFLN